MKNLFFNAAFCENIGREPATEMERSEIEVRSTASGKDAERGKSWVQDLKGEEK